MIGYLTGFLKTKVFRRKIIRYVEDWYDFFGVPTDNRKIYL